MFIGHFAKSSFVRNCRFDHNDLRNADIIFLPLIEDGSVPTELPGF